MKEKVCPVCGSTHLKQGKFIPGTGRPVLAPADISFETVSCILVENDVYLDEIKRQTAEIDTRSPVASLNLVLGVGPA